jgi:hypothetical protein
MPGADEFAEGECAGVHGGGDRGGVVLAVIVAMPVA